MQTIKKYANRKLYHTNRKQYITLDGIAALIQAGEQVQVLDNETGEDITCADSHPGGAANRAAAATACRPRC